MKGLLGNWTTSHGGVPRQCVESVFVKFSKLFRGLHAFSACAVYDTNFPIQCAIQTLIEFERIAIPFL